MNVYFADNQLFELIEKFMSCMVSVLMVFRFFDTKYLRTYCSRLLYIGVKVVCCLLNFGIYLFNSPFANISFWIVIILVAGKFFYYDEISNKGKYYLINVAFILAYSTCEAIGGILAGIGINAINVNQSETVISFVYTLGSSTSAILLYYFVLKRLFISEKTSRISVSQYTIYSVVTVYVLINIGEILFLIRHQLTSKDYLFLMVDATFVILINLYLFYLLDTFAENKDLRYKLALYESQAQSNYEYYTKKIESQKTAMAVLHDIRKHIKVMEELKQFNISTEMENYTNSFEDMIAPLLVRQYCDNPILNIIINDKADHCEKNGIEFEVEIEKMPIDFMEPIDITTIFGNILDNAIEACEKSEDKKILLMIHPFNDFIYVQLSNSFLGSIKWSAKGRPLSGKGEQHGIGLENVEKALKNYYGNIQFSVENQIFTVEIMISRI